MWHGRKESSKETPGQQCLLILTCQLLGSGPTITTRLDTVPGLACWVINFEDMMEMDCLMICQTCGTPRHGILILSISVAWTLLIQAGSMRL
ncbi:hypothetical protein C9E81_22105 [Paracoccus alkanivorans]|uniref:Uncharacterized protein n=1 Tax=Paracoccus alkanivorans TaxID=2116655 RepID=A0A3M0MFL6_9RHOB|nr:hypothetical protein C9E81_22105 [Paracoccus alkanivorans]